MASYIKSTDFSVKDDLVTGDPDKRIKGVEIDDEFDAIAVAVGTKADLFSPNFLGVPTAATASPGVNNTQLATTAFVTAAINATKNALYPIGSIYTNATNNTNPATLLGFGTWTAFGAGRVMVGFNGSDPLFDTAEETGGSKDATVVSHTHTASTNTTGAHQHLVANDVDSRGGDTPLTNTQSINRAGGGGGDSQYILEGTDTPADRGITTSNGDHSHTVTVASTGSSGTNANLQPYITVYLWKRVS
jgi:hypothetical protein